ncbi:hypothetical protein LOK49_LG12G01206 [Camellia lanceoleosa]|uniref:Uncharacterized protein n=1 Tax=Camellia lanceoleosa TaxID=1840588 RepID=A0ACC0FW79_9ERIC|nr:hypothetical protein LOK49_LG12G01206 [Camellia lanceoleosa]
MPTKASNTEHASSALINFIPNCHKEFSQSIQVLPHHQANMVVNMVPWLSWAADRSGIFTVSAVYKWSELPSNMPTKVGCCSLRQCVWYDCWAVVSQSWGLVWREGCCRKEPSWMNVKLYWPQQQLCRAWKLDGMNFYGENFSSGLLCCCWLSSVGFALPLWNWKSSESSGFALLL